MLTCPRKFEHYAVYGRDSAEVDARNYGSAMHTALETFYLADDQEAPEVLDAMQDRIMQYFALHPCSANGWRHADHALEACRRYFNWRKQCPPWIPVVHQGKKMVEIPFKHFLLQWVNPTPHGQYIEYPENLVVAATLGTHPVQVYKINVYWTGVIDLVIDKTGDRWPVDHKTTSVEGALFYDSFRLSSQLMGYAWATQKTLGCKVPGAVVDALIGRAPTKTGVSHENKSFPVEFTQEQLDDWEADTKDHVRTLIRRLFDGFFPKQTPWCIEKYGKCPYHDVCTMSHASQPLILMSGQYAERTWDPLNKEKLPALPVPA